MKSLILYAVICLILINSSCAVRAPSKNSNEEFNLVLENDLQTAAKLYWINSQGELEEKLVLSPGSSNLQKSFRDHRWLIARQQGADVEFDLGKGLFTNSGNFVKLSSVIRQGDKFNNQPNKFNNQQQQPRPNLFNNQLQQGGSSNPDSECNRIFQDEMLIQHNNARSRHNAPRMQLSNELTSHAVSAANAGAQRGSQIGSTDRNNMGENMGALLGGGGIDKCADMARQIFTMWYKGESFYNYNAGQFSTSSGLFTQVVWASSTQLGCGVKCNGGNCYAVCNYRDVGNVMGQFTNNVFPPQ